MATPTKPPRRGYRVQEHPRECRSCVNKDAIREAIPPGTGKQRIDICRIDHLPVDLAGVCTAFVRNPAKKGHK